MKKFSPILVSVILVALAGYYALRYNVFFGPVIIAIAIIPLSFLKFSGLSISKAIPDVIFGAVDTGIILLIVLLGSKFFGITGAIGGAILGNTISDTIAGYFEGLMSEGLREEGYDESRCPVTSGLGKMSGSLLGSGGLFTIWILF